MSIYLSRIPNLLCVTKGSPFQQAHVFDDASLPSTGELCWWVMVPNWGLWGNARQSECPIMLVGLPHALITPIRHRSHYITSQLCPTRKGEGPMGGASNSNITLHGNNDAPYTRLKNNDGACQLVHYSLFISQWATSILIYMVSIRHRNLINLGIWLLKQAGLTQFVHLSRFHLF